MTKAEIEQVAEEEDRSNRGPSGAACVAWRGRIGASFVACSRARWAWQEHGPP